VSASGIGPDFTTAAPVSLYGGTKLASEAMALEYGEAFGFPVWINRCGVLAGAGQFGTADQGIFAYWVNTHLRRRPLRYIGFDGTGKQARDAFHPRDLASLLDVQIRQSRAAGRRVYTVGGGIANCMSLAQLTAWCDARFSAQPVESDLRPRPYDIPWIAMDNTAAVRDFGWQPETPISLLLEEIACHAEENPDWLERSGL
jgi:CDP-paratose 2-epimerase